MNYNGAKQKRMLLKTENPPSLPPREWIETQCLLYVTVLQQYVQTYVDREEATARAEECLDNVFNKHRRTERDHPHRRAFLKQMRAFMRSSLNAGDIDCLRGTGCDSNDNQRTAKQLVDRHLPALLHHLETMTHTAQQVVYNDAGCSDLDAKRQSNVRVLDRMRESWHRKRSEARVSLQSATEARDFAAMNECRSLVDKAEQMCLYYGRVTKRLSYNNNDQKSREAAFTLDEAAFEHRKDAVKEECKMEQKQQNLVAENESPLVEQTAAAAAAPAVSGPFLTFLHNASTPSTTCANNADKERILEAERTVADALQRFVGDSLQAHNYAGAVELAAFLEAVVTDNADSKPLPPMLRVIGSLSRLAHAYQTAYTGLLRGSRVADVQAKLLATLPVDDSMEKALCPNAAIDLRSLASPSHVGVEQPHWRTREQCWLRGAVPRVDCDSEQVQELIETMTANLPTPFQIVRGINDPRARQLREQAFCGPRLPQWNDVCSSDARHRDAVLGVLAGTGRQLTREELAEEKSIRRLFLAEPGCFQILAYHRDSKEPIDQKSVQHAAIVRVARPHVTLTHAVLAPGTYIVGKTIYMPGIEKGIAVAVRSHVLEDVPAHRLSRGGERAQKPLYETHVYDAAQVEHILTLNPSHWSDVYALTPTATLHAGNATLFMAAFATSASTDVARDDTARLQPLGYVVAGNAGRCLTRLSTEQVEQSSGYTVRDCKFYTQTVYTASLELDALYIHSLCGSNAGGSGGGAVAHANRAVQRAIRPRGVGYFLMAQALAYHARAQPSGVLMNVRSSDTVALGERTVDASVAFYYYRHFDLRFVAQSADMVAQVCGLKSIESHYLKSKEVVTKRQLKQDGVYAHLCNIVSCLQERKTSEHSPISVRELCGSTPETECYRFLHDFVPRLSTSSAAPLVALNANGLMFRTYPHMVEVRMRLLQHFDKLCAGNGTAERRKNDVALLQSEISDNAPRAAAAGWQVLEDDVSCRSPVLCILDDETNIAADAQDAESISESLGAW